MQGKIFFSLNIFQIGDLWFSNCEGEKWKRRYWGRKLAYLVILHDVWPVPTNGWILLPSLMRLQISWSPRSPGAPPPHHQPYPEDFTSLWQISKVNDTQNSPENVSRGCWAWDRVSKMPEMGWVGDRPPHHGPWCWATTPETVPPSKSHIRIRWSNVYNGDER